METLNIKQKLLKIQVELKAPKSQHNSFGNYNYRNCEDILEALKPLLNKYETTIRIFDDINFIEGRFYVVATAELMDCKNGDFISVKAFARETESKKGMDEAQITGAASSYARKYALNGLFAIDDTKDADSQDNTKNQQTIKAPPKVKDDPKKAEIKTLCDHFNPLLTKKEDYEECVKLKTGLDLKPENYDEIINRLLALKNGS